MKVSLSSVENIGGGKGICILITLIGILSNEPWMAECGHFGVDKDCDLG